MDLIRQICLYILIDINVNINQSLWFDLLLFVFIYTYCCQICFDMLLCSYYVDFVLKQKFDDTREVIKSHKSKKDKQYNGQKKKDKW
jgi:hypothetical protein